MRILFVCTGNTCRSPMAEAIVRAHAAKRGIDVEVSSAGTHAETVLTTHAVEVLHARGIEAGARRAVQLTPELLDAADLVLGMTAEHVAAAEKSGITAHLWTTYTGVDGDIPDPMGHGLAAYEATATRMTTLAEALLDTL